MILSISFLNITSGSWTRGSSAAFSHIFALFRKYTLGTVARTLTFRQQRNPKSLYSLRILTVSHWNLVIITKYITHYLNTLIIHTDRHLLSERCTGIYVQKDMLDKDLMRHSKMKGHFISTFRKVE